MKFFVSLLLLSLSLFAGLEEDLRKFGKKPGYGLPGFRTNKIMRISGEQVLRKYDKKIGSHLVVVGLPDKRPYKEPVIIAGGLMSSHQGYSDMAEGYKKLGHPVFIISPPGHGAHDTLDKTPMFVGDHNFVDSYALRIESLVKYIESVFPDQKIVLTGHSLGAIASSLYVYGLSLEGEPKTITHNPKVARSRWNNLKGVIYNNGPLLLDMDSQADDLTEKTIGTLGPALENGPEILKKSSLIRSIFESPNLGFIPRLSTGLAAEFAFWATRGFTEESINGLINHKHVKFGDIARLVHSVATTTNLPEGIKFSILINAVFKVWTPTHEVYQKLIESQLIDGSEKELKALNTFLISLIMEKEEPLKFSFLKKVNRKLAFEIIADAVTSSTDMEPIIKNPTEHIGALRAKPKEIALVADADPLGNSDVMTTIFRNGELKRKVYRNTKGHLGVMSLSYSENELPLVLQGLEQNFKGNDWINLDAMFPPKDYQFHDCDDFLKAVLGF